MKKMPRRMAAILSVGGYWGDRPFSFVFEADNDGDAGKKGVEITKSKIDRGFIVSYKITRHK